MTDTALVEPTQEDREAAAALSAQIAQCSINEPQIKACTDGKQDDTFIVQAFARHRIAAVEADRRARTFSPTEIDQAVEAELALVVGWMRAQVTCGCGRHDCIADNYPLGYAKQLECGDHRTHRSQDNAG